MKKGSSLLLIFFSFVLHFHSQFKLQTRIDTMYLTVRAHVQPSDLTGFHCWLNDAEGDSVKCKVSVDIVSRSKFYGIPFCFPLSVDECTLLMFTALLPNGCHDNFLLIGDDDEEDDWVVPNQKFPFCSFQNIPSKSWGKSLQVEGSSLVRNCFQLIRKPKFNNEFCGSLVVDDLEIGALSTNQLLDRRMIERDGWNFEKLWYLKKKGKMTTVITVYRIRKATEQNWIFQVLGESYPNQRDIKMAHPDIRDVNFDGVPDLVVNGLQGENNKYFGYNVKSGRFEELFITHLENLNINFISQVIDGDEWIFEDGVLEPLGKVHYQLKGKHWQEVDKKKIFFRMPQLQEEEVFHREKLLSQTAKGLVFELVMTDVVKQCDVANKYLRIYREEDHALLYEDTIAGGFPAEDITNRMNFFIVKDYNNDSIMDVYIPRGGIQEADLFYFSDFSDSIIQYQRLAGYSYLEVMMMNEKVVFSMNKMVLREFEDYNLDGWLDYRRYTQMGKSTGFWSYFIYQPESGCFPLNPAFGLLDGYAVNTNLHIGYGWKETSTSNGDAIIRRYRLINGQLVELSGH